MAKLGNDPFLRGAASRDAQENAPPPATGPVASRPSTKPTVREPRPPGGRAAKAGNPNPRKVRKAATAPPTPHPDSPVLVANVSAAPPTPHHGSPGLVANVTAAPPTPHPDSPVLVANLAAALPTPHQNSPVLIANVTSAPPTPHHGSPVLVADVAAAPPTPHHASPILVANVAAAPPTPHHASPVLVANVAAAPPTPHHASPVLVANVAAAPPTPHQDSPALVEAGRSQLESAEWVPVELPEEHPSLHRAPPPRRAAAHSFWREPPDRSLAAADSHRLRDRAPGALGVARELFAQLFASPTLQRTLAAAEGLWRATSTTVGVSSSIELDDYGRDATLVRSLQPVFDFFYDRYWRVKVEGADHVPHGPVILVANHSGALPFDGPMVAQALSRERADLREARWLVEDQIFHAPFLGTLANRLGAIRACPENAYRLLAEERPLLVFPEGVQGIGKTFKDRYQLQRFGRGGFVKIALRTGTPIVPLAVVGAEESMPVLAKLPGGVLGLPYLPITPLGPVPLPARWSIRFGEPLDLGGAGADGEYDLPRVQRITERTRESIQGMLTALLQERGSIF